jgi:uncharacterized protein (DUF779 family)
MPDRVVATPDAVALIRLLKAEHGPLVFHQSGGCCEGTAPMCFKPSDFRIGLRDVFLGGIEGCPFYIGAGQFAYFACSQLIIDVTTGGGDSFSLEAPEGVRFVTRSRLFADAEMVELDALGPPPAGPQAFRRPCGSDKTMNQGQHS